MQVTSSLALVGNSPRDGVSIKILVGGEPLPHLGGDALHRPAFVTPALLSAVYELVILDN